MMKIINNKTAAYVVDKVSNICRRWPVTGIMCAKCQNYNILSNRPQNKTNYIKFKTKVLKEINPNLGGLSRGLFLPPCSNETTSLKTISLFELVYISCISYIRLLWPMSVLTKKLSRIKKVSIKVFLN